MEIIDDDLHQHQHHHDHVEEQLFLFRRLLAVPLSEVPRRPLPGGALDSDQAKRIAASNQVPSVENQISQDRIAAAAPGAFLPMDRPDIEPVNDLLTMSALISGLSSIFMIFGGTLPYIPQYLDIQRTENAEGFSLYVCLTLLIANTLRIIFWFGNHFELPLLAQSVVMNLVMLCLVELCVRIRNRTIVNPGRQRYFLDNGFGGGDPLAPSPSRPPTRENLQRTILDFEWKYFWRWTDFSSYLEFMGMFALVMGVMMYLMCDVPTFVDLIGYVALFIEAMLGLPQLLKNFRNKSTYGMSFYMVMGWLVGDLYKCGYFYLRAAPIQFLVCGLLQVTIDMAIFGQVFFYGTRPPPHHYARLKTTDRQL